MKTEYLPYNSSIKLHSQELRKNMTPWERKLWYLFLRKHPVTFKRQTMIGNFIVDFYCPQAKLVIELDGSGHYTDEQKLDDEKRTKKLALQNVRVIRFANTDIDRNFSGVCAEIDRQVKFSTHPPAT